MGVVVAGALSAWLCWLLTGFGAADRAWAASTLRRGLAGAERSFANLRRSMRARMRPRRARAVQETTLGQIAEMIDVVRLGLSAGLSFDAALELFCAHRSSALAKRMERARLSWQMGIATRGEELERVARDLGERSLESFGIAVDQALSLGSPLSETLAAQGREMRAAHRAHVEREIERAPVKLLIPTGTLILPALLLSIVGPLLAASGMV